MLTGGKLADLFGRRLMFVVGLVDLHRLLARLRARRERDVLIGARVVQGLGAALMNPSTLSIITVTFPPRQRGTAIGIWAGVSALALAIGPLVGGVITEHINWNWIFFINVPIGAIGIAARSRSSTSRATPRASSGPTSPGLATSALGLFALSYGADRGEQLRLGLGADPRSRSRSPRSRSSRSSCSSCASGCRCSTSRSSATAPSPARTR